MLPASSRCTLCTEFGCTADETWVARKGDLDVLGHGRFGCVYNAGRRLVSGFKLRFIAWREWCNGCSDDGIILWARAGARRYRYLVSISGCYHFGTDY